MSGKEIGYEIRALNNTIRNRINKIKASDATAAQTTRLQAWVVAFVFEALAAMGPVLIVLLLLDGFMGVITLLLGYTGVALWMRQFNVPAWRADEDPLPPFVSDPRDPTPDSPAGNSWQTGEACPEPEPVSASGPVQEEGGAQAEKDEGPSLPPADDLDSLT